LAPPFVLRQKVENKIDRNFVLRKSQLEFSHHEI
jgi:hypothetical protein